VDADELPDEENDGEGYKAAKVDPLAMTEVTLSTLGVKELQEVLGRGWPKRAVMTMVEVAKHRSRPAAVKGDKRPS